MRPSDVQYILSEAANGFTYVQWLDNDTAQRRPGPLSQASASLLSRAAAQT
jgi:hypothetical protein